ncbi:hypothetical protein SAMN02745121_08701 [Nannocystis exedens]|uniref:Uncharacterized protein n=1 Tax=Nannocystis exedens TaxID=54 RepID=A0A1I2IGD3_9BACT|nr:hypothetical protein [Nannocystis exedens]PCC67194.1 hypothetical protein NAEX_00197 [Nannocystis exedens]SFF41284.1 hypothetical protein SAMN02745121_08701 [Nannocystis exedens]
MRALEGQPPVAREPYRSFVETALERALREGLPAWSEPGPPHELWGAARVAAVFTAAVFGVAMVPQLFAAFLLWNVFALARSAVDPEVPADGWLRRRIARYPLPVGDLRSWLLHGAVWFGKLELVLRQGSELAVAAVRLVEPDARLAWTGPATLRVDVPWARQGGDHRRFDRLVRFLAAHRGELQLVRIALVPRDEPGLKVMSQAPRRRPTWNPEAEAPRAISPGRASRPAPAPPAPR